MTKPELISETPISMAEMKEELAKIKKRDEELNFRATKTEEYLQQFDIPSVKKMEELKKSIEALKIPRLKDEHLIKILDTMPKSLEEMKMLMQGYTITMNQENMKKIATKIKEF